MIRSRNRLRICAVLIVLNVAFIWCTSLLPQEVSAGFSRFVGQIVDWLFPSPGTAAEGEGQGILRKIAHFTEFAALGALLSWLVRMLRQKNGELFVFPVAGGVTVACLDELIQCFVPGRGPGLLDVGIDSAGVLLGMFLVFLLARCRKRQSN